MEEKSLFQLMFGEIDVDVAIALALDNPGLWVSAEVESFGEPVTFKLKMYAPYVNKVHKCFIREEKCPDDPKKTMAWFRCPNLYQDAFRSLEPKESL